jgi:ribosomal protein S18 acetylase RimI-like enzyme
MERGIEYAKEKKRKVMELWVGYKNYKAQKFYQKMGFERKSTFGKWIRMIRIL